MIEPRKLFFALVRLRCASCLEDFDGDERRFVLVNNRVYCQNCQDAAAGNGDGRGAIGSADGG